MSSVAATTQNDRISEQQTHLTPSHKPRASFWDLPGLDKDTFYAAALYLHCAAGYLKGKEWIRGPKTPEKTRNFLDRLADCFARSKLQDARDHVSATAMVRKDEEKMIILYIAKNQSSNGCFPLFPREKLHKIENENTAFADDLIRWFNQLANGEEDEDPDLAIFKSMCSFTWSRLEHYIKKVGESDVAHLDNVVEFANLDNDLQEGWEFAKILISQCKDYWEDKSKLPDSSGGKLCLLTNHAFLAGQIRKYPGFRKLTDKVGYSPPESRLKKLSQPLKWINYLGRLHAVYTSFSKFCQSSEQMGYSFSYCLLPSIEETWKGDVFVEKIQSWAGDLGFDDESAVSEKTVLESMHALTEPIHNIARVHCEMQLLIHFSQPSAEKCLDYFGCSKKSCWLCWEMMRQNSRFSMKDTHRKLYPRWAFPFDYETSQLMIAEGLRVAYNSMLSIIQDKIIRQRSLTFLPPHPQSSARMTPGPALANSRSDVITGPDPDTFPVVSIPALLLPGDA